MEWLKKVAGNPPGSCSWNIIFIYIYIPKNAESAPIIITRRHIRRPSAEVAIQITSWFLGVEIRHQQLLKFSRYSNVWERNCEESTIRCWGILAPNPKIKTTKETKTHFSVFSSLTCCYIKQHNHSLEPHCTVRWLLCGFSHMTDPITPNEENQRLGHIFIRYSVFSILGS